MKVSVLKDGLLALLPLLESFGAKKMTADLQKLIDLLKAHEDLSVDVFIKRARSGLEGGDKPKGSAKGGRGEASSTLGSDDVKSGLVAAYIAKLHNEAQSDDGFQAALKELNADKRVRLIELKEIAAGFMSTPPYSGKRADILKELSQKRAKDLRTAHKLNLLSKW